MWTITTDLLITEQLPGISGYQSVVRNIGSVVNKGLELNLGTVNMNTKNFTWTSDLNISFNKNRVKNIGSGDRIPITPTAIMQGHFLDVFYVREGYPIGAMFGYKTDGLYQCRDFSDFYDANGTFISDKAQQKAIYDNIKGNNGQFTLLTITAPSRPALTAIWNNGASNALRMMFAPVFSSPSKSATFSAAFLDAWI